ncbi:ABC transporter ATP-binding protein [Persephonella sp.]
MNKLIEIVNLEKEYENFGVKTKVLKGINLTVEKGEFVSIMGVSGSGKTTLMNIIGCLDTPTSGKYFFEGVDVSQLDDDRLSEIRNKHIGFVFQQFYLISYLNVLENVLVPTIYSNENKGNVVKRAEELLRRVGLEEKKSFKPNQLSGGQQQRVAIARALINDPDLILADEPTGALDSKTASEIMEIFKSLHKEGRTIIVVTHDYKVASIADRIIRIEDGKIID